MIPIRDTTPLERFPLVNYTLVAACTAAFVWEIRVSPELETVFHTYGVIPARFLALGERGTFLDPDLYAPFVTSTFLHGGSLHFLLNMLFLWVFGGGVEDRLGKPGYLLFYVLGGVIAALTHVAANPTSLVPTIGASGAIAAVMGSYFVLYPRAWVSSFIFPVFWLQFRVPALVFLAIWFGVQLYMGNAPAEDDGQGGVAWWAHVGGFAFGMATILLLGRKRA